MLNNVMVVVYVWVCYVGVISSSIGVFSRVSVGCSGIRYILCSIVECSIMVIVVSMNSVMIKCFW